MHKPLELPLKLRVWNFVRGLLFYSTVYWRRASDDVNPPKLTREERLAYQPERDPKIIRPRGNPRARLGATCGGEVSLPVPTLPPAVHHPPEDEVSALPAAPVYVPPAMPPVARLNPPPALTGMNGEELIVKRRRLRRRSSKARALFLAADTVLDTHMGLFARLFKRGG